jgi:hypothetical protein
MAPLKLLTFWACLSAAVVAALINTELPQRAGSTRPDTLVGFFFMHFMFHDMVLPPYRLKPPQ